VPFAARSRLPLRAPANIAADSAPQLGPLHRATLVRLVGVGQHVVVCKEELVRHPGSHMLGPIFVCFPAREMPIAYSELDDALAMARRIKAAGGVPWEIDCDDGKTIGQFEIDGLGGARARYRACRSAEGLPAHNASASQCRLLFSASPVTDAPPSHQRWRTLGRAPRAPRFRDFWCQRGVECVRSDVI
jgi:hypothetical protein